MILSDRLARPAGLAQESEIKRLAKFGDPSWLTETCGVPSRLASNEALVGSAIISPCGLYRYRLEREGPGEGATTIIMVNPSTADAENDDATIRKLRGFGQRYQWGRIIVGNLFAYRATDVRELATCTDPVGADNDGHLMDMLREADRFVVAWGPAAKLPKRLRGRYRRILELASLVSRRPMSIGKPAKDGHPCHPLMLPYSLELQPWSPAL